MFLAIAVALWVGNSPTSSRTMAGETAVAASKITITAIEGSIDTPTLDYVEVFFDYSDFPPGSTIYVDVADACGNVFYSGSVVVGGSGSTSIDVYAEVGTVWNIYAYGKPLLKAASGTYTPITPRCN